MREIYPYAQPLIKVFRSCLNSIVARKNSKHKTKIKRLLLILAPSVLFLLLFSWGLYLRLSPIKIGVILNLIGPEALPYKQVFEWARENSGKNIEFVYVDANTADIKKAAEPLLVEILSRHCFSFTKS
jgi:hypothetical protein